jgi:hypothetical protein
MLTSSRFPGILISNLYEIDSNLCDGGGDGGSGDGGGDDDDDDDDDDDEDRCFLPHVSSIDDDDDRYF